MIVSTDNVELKRLVSAIAGAMAQDEHMLLSQADWMAILTTAAEEVAANPGRLLGMTGGTVTGSLLATLLNDIHSVAVEAWKSNARAGGAVLFGATLRDAMQIAIRACAGQAAAALLNSAKVKE